MAVSAKINSVKEIKREVKLLRSFVIGQSGKDPEGKYNQAFVKKVFKSFEQKPKHEFKDAASFLRNI